MKRLDLDIRIWKMQSSVIWNKSMNQLQISVGKRFFEGSNEYKKAFFVVKSSYKDIIVFPRKSKNKALVLKDLI